MDLHVDRQGDVVFKNGDLSLIDGNAEFEATLARWLQHTQQDVVGEASREANTIEHLRVTTKRVVSQSDIVDGIESFNAYKSGSRSFTVEVKYYTDELRYFEETIGANQ